MTGLEPKRLGVPTDLTDIPGAIGAQVAARQFGAQTDSRTTQVTVTTSRTNLLPNNPRRIWWFIQNLSVNNGYLLSSDQGIGSTGVLIGAAGGFAMADALHVGQMVTYEVNAIQLVASGTWLVMEGFAS